MYTDVISYFISYVYRCYQLFDQLCMQMLLVMYTDVISYCISYVYRCYQLFYQLCIQMLLVMLLVMYTDVVQLSAV